MKAVIVCQKRQEPSGDRGERTGPVDQQQLLLDSDGERLGSIECRAEGVPAARVGGTSDLG
jgi:hypothetical protein